MDIKPPSRVNPVQAYKDQTFERESDAFSLKKLKEILLSLRTSIQELSDWTKKLAFTNKEEIDEEMLLQFLKKIKHFYGDINDLEEFIDTPESRGDLHYALEIRAEIDDMLKYKIKKLTLCSFHNFDDFSFDIAMEKAIIFPLDEIKKMMTHLFDEIPDKNWDKVIDAYEKMAKKLLV
jgi:hypothetical protein